jgi:hypothetical protein
MDIKEVAAYREGQIGTIQKGQASKPLPLSVNRVGRPRRQLHEN